MEITANVKAIGDKAFSSCNSVKEFVVAYNNANYTAVDGVLYNKAKTELVRYPNGKTETIFKIPDDVKKEFYSKVDKDKVNVLDEEFMQDVLTFYESAITE